MPRNPAKSESAGQALSEEAARRILDKDTENLIRKVAHGKTLSLAERARIEALAQTPTSQTQARNLVELAAALGVTRRTLANWRKRQGAPKPASNGRHDIAAWRRFAAAHGLGRGHAITANSSDADTTQPEPPPHPESPEGLRARKLKVDLEDHEFRFAVRRSQYIHRDTIRHDITEGIARIFAILHKLLEDELPPLLVGKDAIAIRQQSADALDAARREAAEYFRQWSTNTTAKP